jgi:hypothetical protein
MIALLYAAAVIGSSLLTEAAHHRGLLAGALAAAVAAVRHAAVRRMTHTGRHTATAIAARTAGRPALLALPAPAMEGVTARG